MQSQYRVEYQMIRIGGKIVRVAIITTEHSPWSDFVARKISRPNLQVCIFDQLTPTVKPDSWDFLKNIRQRRGAWTFLDMLLLVAAKTVISTSKSAIRRLHLSGQKSVDISSPADSECIKEAPKSCSSSMFSYTPISRINSGDGLNRLRLFEPDLILLAGAPILKPETIYLARVACINPHCGITPEYAGWSPYHRAAFEGKFDEIGYTIHLVNPKVDSGAVIYQHRVQWDKSQRLGRLWPVLSKAMYEKLSEIAIKLIEGEELVAKPQGPVRIIAPAGLFVRVAGELRRILHWAGVQMRFIGH